MNTAAPAIDRMFNFVGGNVGPWLVDSVQAVVGDPLCITPRVAVMPGQLSAESFDGSWLLRGITSNERYVIRNEKTALVSKQEGLGRISSTHAALIPIRKTTAWWLLTQDERRDIFEAQSHHIDIGLKYLPAIARRLHHCRDISPNEPFDFLTWFEYAHEHSNAFEELVQALRESPEWNYVEREVDIRLRLVGEG